MSHLFLTAMLHAERDALVQRDAHGLISCPQMNTGIRQASKPCTLFKLLRSQKDGVAKFEQRVKGPTKQSLLWDGSRVWKWLLPLLTKIVAHALIRKDGVYKKQTEISCQGDKMTISDDRFVI